MVKLAHVYRVTHAEQFRRPRFPTALPRGKMIAPKGKPAAGVAVLPPVHTAVGTHPAVGLRQVWLRARKSHPIKTSDRDARVVHTAWLSMMLDASHGVPTAVLGGRCSHYSHEETEAQEGGRVVTS